ncbi:MAG: LUD domain-containing protein [Proteobacteria bacterium]|nr:LUD domain-containing protein [Pseudomonadota bacterium]
MSAREDILDGLRQTLGHGDCPDRPHAKAKAHGKDDWALLRERAELRGVRYIPAKDLEAARGELTVLLTELGATSALVWEHHDLDALGLAEILAELKIKVIPHDAPLDQRAGADVGITSSQAVLPESGSVIVSAGPGTPRQTSLLPPVHIALALPGRAVPTITDLPAFIRSQVRPDGFLPSALHIITGPSSTADIEKIVVKGVHGPTVCAMIAVEG